jgi:DNA-binding PadR family transcriptional regulator
MYKQVMLLGLLLDQPMYGQQIREVIESHHDLFAEHIKKPTIYYQLDRLAQDGYLTVRREEVAAPGPGQAHEEVAPREREVYHITPAGRAHFANMLRQVLRDFVPGMSEVDAGLFFLRHLPPAESATLLTERRARIARYRAQMDERIKLLNHDDAAPADPAHALVNDHLLTLLEAELGWLDRAIAQLRTSATPRR